MLQPVYTHRFKKDIVRCKRRKYNMELFKEVAALLLEEMTLPVKYGDHKLSGKFEKHRECHITPDWLLIYCYDRKHTQVIFEQTGTHSDLFG
jgi:mRNA interferase YafQ